jgi:peptidyl-prolyl cis-trans isomerase D
MPDSELRAEFQRNNQEAQVAYVLFKKDDFKKSVKSAEADLQAYFNAHKDKYNIKERRRAQYLLIPVAGVASSISVTDQEVRDQWAQQPHPETVTASHILFKFDPGTKEADVKAKAEEVLKRVKAGEDFAELARKYSQDPGSAKNGGDLGSFTREQMVKEFADVAFALKPGETSDLVRSQFGYHIIKVARHDLPALESNRKAIEQAIKDKKATEIVKQKAQEAQRLAESQKDLNVIAKTLNVPSEIRETPLISRDSDPYANGVSQTMVDEMFQLKDLNAIGKPVEMPLGQALPKLIEVQLPKPPNFAEAHASVEKDYIDAKAGELARADAQKFSDEATKAGDIEKAAQKQKLAVKTSQSFKRDGQVDTEIGAATQFTGAAFERPVGSISAPIELDGGNKIAVFQVKSRSPFDEAAFNKQKNELRDRLLGYQQDSYFQEYIRRVTENLTREGKIRINPKAVEQVAQIRY